MRASLRIITLLCLYSMKVSALDRFPEKFVAGQEDSDIPLSCDKATKMPVTWNFEDEDASIYKNVLIDGKTVTLQSFKEDMTGNFSCWSEGKEVDYTYVLLDTSNNIKDFPISCTAETFNCTSTITCTMSEKGYDYFRLRSESGHWLNPSRDGRFYLEHTTNPFAEESKPIVVVGEGVSKENRYFTTNYSFYIRSIIRPGYPQVAVSKTVNGSVLDINPPTTWTLPLSYYPLENEIEFQKKTNGMITSQMYTQPNNTNTLGGKIAVPTGTNKVRARCRDFLLQSQWSEWTEWKNVGKRRKSKQKSKNKKKKGSVVTRADQI